MRSVDPEIEALQAEMLAAYRPPLSIDKHREFIIASSTLKEARELDAAGLRYGALLRYLQAVAAVRACVRPHASAPAATRQRPRRAAARVRRPPLREAAPIPSLGRVFVESAQAKLADPAEGTNLADAAPLVDDVLPRYFAALGPEPARPAAPKPALQATVTLVRWPYT